MEGESLPELEAEDESDGEESMVSDEDHGQMISYLIEPHDEETPDSANEDQLMIIDKGMVYARAPIVQESYYLLPDTNALAPRS